jgi:hypothetical protein
MVALGVFLPSAANAQSWLHDDSSKTNRSIFRPLDWPAPNDLRNGAGSPGARYWQQQVDYSIDARLDTVEQVIHGSERITYHNNSPDQLRYLWVQLDQNVRSLEHSRAYQLQGPLPEEISPRAREFFGQGPFDGGHIVTRVQLVEDGQLVDTRHLINGTVMRVDLARPFAGGEGVQCEIDWSYRIPSSGRGGKDQVSDGWIYEMAQWFPRLAVYDDVNGWQTDQFFGRGEFYLEFGNYDVRVTVPWNHIVDATGVLQNPEEVLTQTQRDRLTQALAGTEPQFILTADEVQTPASRPVHEGTLTWHYRAENVRDFAWVSSTTFVWDAAGYRYEPDGDVIKLYSFYPRDAMPLWDSVSTRAIAQTMETYGRMAFRYPYPKATNVNGLAGGMEYPMMAFCGMRPNPDGTYSPGVAYALISVTIHEVGHNWFPMIVASDERKWTWMDEGLNSFLQHYAEADWEEGYPHMFGPAPGIVPYMRDPDQVPIMTASDLIHNGFGPNGYAKPAAGLKMLREQVLGETLFDAAFSEYSQKWMFKKPQPADFFRSMEDGAGELLNWYWRGWFYTTHANDQALASVTSQSAEELLGDTERGQHYYRIQVDNEGGLVMPLQLGITYEDGTTELIKLPADIWRYDELSFTYGFFTDQAIAEVMIDPNEVFADINRDNNGWTRPTP